MDRERALLIKVPPGEYGPPKNVASRWLSTMGHFFRRQPLGGLCGVIVLSIIVLAVLAPNLAPYDANRNNVGAALASPSRDHWLGTDNYGRDVFSRILVGARVSMYVGLAATLVSVLIATVVGMLSGYFGGVLDFVAQRLVDVAQAIPGFILLASIMIVLGPSITNVIIALSVRGGLTLGRVVRGSVLGISSLPYIDAARAVGVSPARIVFRHVLPNIVPTLLVLFSIGVGANIVAEASLSFLGYGVPPPDPTWGGMMSAEGRLYMLLAPWLLIAPTMALAVVVYAVNMFGDALRDELDPRLRGSR
jgi:peptide/nickel transport system permease protein